MTKWLNGSMRKALIAVLLSILCGVVCAQEKAVPVGEEGHHQLVLENEYTRVFHVVLAPKESTLMHQHDRDYVYVMIGSSQVEVVKPGAPPTQMKLNDGDVKFTKAPLAHKVTNTGDTPFVNLTIEVKKASTKAVCGASWAGQRESEPCRTTAMHAGGVSEVPEKYNLATDAVSADSVDTPRPYGISTGYGSLVVALSPLTVQPFGRRPEHTIAGEHRLQPGDVLSFAPHQWAALVPDSGQTAKFVIVEFK
jgi:quercetin dioxygenase-like cupin family protein